jgi:hypothetical protein
VGSKLFFVGHFAGASAGGNNNDQQGSDCEKK